MNFNVDHSKKKHLPKEESQPKQKGNLCTTYFHYDLVIIMIIIIVVVITVTPTMIAVAFSPLAENVSTHPRELGGVEHGLVLRRHELTSTLLGTQQHTNGRTVRGGPQGRKQVITSH